ncbi:helix-turn-helix domain-containing protein [Arthrobacter sp. HY1533]|uniref:helix-turn-helix domain-containing protein n=1 Tax=Arthrobacter sp. HY1533 TaxID=2970919 RepID=UPI0022BA0B65|nr:helix-turn-helix domain-containing protein [Arthrobacter sp. HY1533]
MDDGTVVGRALEIMNAVALRLQTPLAELAARTGIPKPTARRIAEDLVRRQILVRAPHGYAMGCALDHFSQAAALQRMFPDAHEQLVELQARCGGNAWFSAVGRTGTAGPAPVEMVHDAGLPAPDAAPWPDLTNPKNLVNTAAGHLVLAHRPELLEQVARTGLPRATPYSPATVRQLEGILRQIHELGASVESEQYMLGWRCVAVQFRGPGDSRVILGVSAPTGRSDPARMLKATLQAAASMQASAGSPPANTAGPGAAIHTMVPPAP